MRRVAQDMRRHVKYSGGYSDRDSFIADFWKVTSALHCTALHCTAYSGTDESTPNALLS